MNTWERFQSLGAKERTMHDDISKQVYILKLKNESTKLEIWKWKINNAESSDYYINDGKVDENKFIDAVGKFVYTPCPLL